MKVANKGFFRQKKHQNFFSKATTEEYNQTNLSIFDKFGIILAFSATFDLEVSAKVLLKVATKGSFRGKKPENLYFLRLFF